MMRPPGNGKGRHRSASDQEARRVGQDDSNGSQNLITGGFITSTTGDDTISRYGTTSRVVVPQAPSLLAELGDSPLIPLAALLLTDASPREIVRRLRLNVAIRMLLDAIAESGVAS